MSSKKLFPENGDNKMTAKANKKRKKLNPRDNKRPKYPKQFFPDDEVETLYFEKGHSGHHTINAFKESRHNYFS